MGGNGETVAINSDWFKEQLPTIPDGFNPNYMYLMPSYTLQPGVLKHMINKYKQQDISKIDPKSYTLSDLFINKGIYYNTINCYLNEIIIRQTDILSVGAVTKLNIFFQDLLDGKSIHTLYDLANHVTIYEKWPQKISNMLSSKDQNTQKLGLDLAMNYSPALNQLDFYKIHYHCKHTYSYDFYEKYMCNQSYWYQEK